MISYAEVTVNPHGICRLHHYRVTAFQTLATEDTSVESVFVKIPATESDINLTESTLVNPYFYEDTGANNVDLLFYFALAMVALLFLEWWLKSREQI